MLIPSYISQDHDTVDLEAQHEMLYKLGLQPLSPDQVVSLICLPSISPRKEGPEATFNPITDTISKWLSTIPEGSKKNFNGIHASLLSTTPKRWSIYPPMLLLPSGSFQSPPWPSLLQTLSPPKREDLWKAILLSVWLKEGGPQLTHIAINSGIPSKQSPLQATTTTATADQPAKEEENILRSPSSLIPLLGDFGPQVSDASPSEQDFSSAFWVSAKQNGIQQVWAPRYTMFSRGNIKEKARILSFRSVSVTGSMALEAEMGMGVASGTEGQRVDVREEEGDEVAVDLYAGIGYFVFSYVRLGVGKVLCWEINPWSVEGLRRGAGKNGWGVRVVRGGDLRAPLWEILSNDEDVKIVVLEESNERATARIRELRQWEGERRKTILGGVIHVNCGFLPTSEPSWMSAWEVVRKEKDSWMHLHENVGVRDVEKRKREIEEKINKWAVDEGCSSLVEVEHVELVKTFAPGVWHCVFDVHIAPPSQTTYNS
jgi:tRNA wybutosine-synthesizing protein 2